jgi:hypothetical protein
MGKLSTGALRAATFVCRDSTDVVMVTTLEISDDASFLVQLFGKYFLEKALYSVILHQDLVGRLWDPNRIFLVA